ncbi:MAG TPA: DeoR/GlpR transcriptional regulator [Clostridiales bacterium]|nr:DeoR/GlpR transcriptional regulator [Clostridiales bacterium]
MKTAETEIIMRRERILQKVIHNRSCSVTELSKLLNVSLTTIRRDLEYLEQEGHLRRYFGGAEISDRKDNIPPILHNRNISLSQPEMKKNAIARKMARFVESGDTIFLNSSSTASRIIRYISAFNVTIITNNGNSVLEPRNPDISLILTGGELNKNKSSITGQFCLDTIKHIKCSKCIIGVSGISVHGGITTSILNETIINHAMMERCQGSVFVVADSTKVGAVHKFYSGEIKDINYLVTDKDADLNAINELRSAGIEIIFVDY